MAKSNINFERSELRYIYYSHDQEAIIQEFENLGFKQIVYEETPTTITMYLGTRNGLEPGLSIKARIYTSTSLQNSWEIHGNVEFNLLEIKSSLDVRNQLDEDVLDDGIDDETGGLMVSIQDISKKDVVFWIQRATEDGLIRDSNLKMKSRLKGTELKQSSAEASNLSFKEVVTILTRASDLDDILAPSLVEVLDTKVRPKYKNNCLPIFITQYNRIHLVPKDESVEWHDMIRVTIDPGVDYYDLVIADKEAFQTDPFCVAELIKREPFGRLEFKIDKKLKKKSIYHEISSILQKYRSVAFLSKKWSGITFVSERYIEKQEFWREPINSEISGFFPVDKSWFKYGVVMQYLHELITESNSFSTHYKQWPRLLVKNENFVTGYIGVPIPSLIVQVEGPSITYHLPPASYPVKLSTEGPDFYINEENAEPVKSTVISSKLELDRVLHPTIEIEGDTYFRSYGLLVRSDKTQRIYKLTIERKTDVKGTQKDSRFYCKMRYIGTEDYLYKINKAAIYSDLQLFYDEFSQVMKDPVIQHFV